MSAPIFPPMNKPGTKRKARRVRGFMKAHKQDQERRKAYAREQARLKREGEWYGTGEEKNDV